MDTVKKVTKFIKRKSLIYKTGVEYGDYTMNHILGCSHGCQYPCYAYLQKKRFGVVKSYSEWCKPAIVENTLELLDKELPRFKKKIKLLHLCFTTDPFMYLYEDIKKLSLDAIEKANSEGVPCSVLTKGLLPIELSELSKKNEYGITLISLDKDFCRKIEPGAAPIDQRLEALRVLHEKGFKTWISLEPYPTPNIKEQNLINILEEISFVDKIVFGRMNYNPVSTSFKRRKEFFNNCSNSVISFCKERNINSHIKIGTMSA